MKTGLQVNVCAGHLESAEMNTREIHLHFRRRENTEPIRLGEVVFGSSEEDMRGLSLWKRLEAYLHFLGNVKIRYPHVEVSFSFKDVCDAGLFSHIDTSETFEDLNISPCRIGASASGQCTFFQPRLYTRELYTTYVITWPKASVDLMIRFAAENQKRPFVHGLFQTFLIPTVPDYRVWFCAQYITVILQQGRVCVGLNPSEMTGDLLIEFVKMYYGAVLTTEPGRAQSVIRILESSAPPSAAPTSYQTSQRRWDDYDHES